MVGVLFLILIAAAGGFGLFGWIGLASVLFVFFALIFFSSIFAEKGIVRALNAHLPQAPGLAETVQQVCHSSGLEPRRVLLFSEPHPRAICARSLGSTGVLILSEGAIDLLGEEDLRYLIAQGLRTLAQPSILSQSARSYLALFLWRGIATRWSGEQSVKSLAMIRVMRDSFLYALYQSLLGARRGVQTNPEALRKLDQMKRVWETSPRHLDPYSPLSIP